MKKVIIALVTLFCFSFQGQAKDAVTKTSFAVSGMCEMCKQRIEKAAKINGVKAAEWNEETRILTVAFVPAKVTVDEIHKSIAKAGYDTEKFKADESDYKKLPQCCQYEKTK